jgi:hypothetical protein
MSSFDPYEQYFTNLSDEPPVLEAGTKLRSGKKLSMRGRKKLSMRGRKKLSMRDGKKLSMRSGKNVSMRGGKKVSMRGGKKVPRKSSGGKKRKMNAYFKAMVAARKKGAESFDYNGTTYYKRMHSIHPNAPPQPLYSKVQHSRSSSHRQNRRSNCKK